MRQNGAKNRERTFLIQPHEEQLQPLFDAYTPFPSQNKTLCEKYSIQNESPLPFSVRSSALYRMVMIDGVIPTDQQFFFELTTKLKV